MFDLYKLLDFFVDFFLSLPIPIFGSTFPSRTSVNFRLFRYWFEWIKNIWNEGSETEIGSYNIKNAYVIEIKSTHSI